MVKSEHMDCGENNFVTLSGSTPMPLNNVAPSSGAEVGCSSRSLSPEEQLQLTSPTSPPPNKCQCPNPEQSDSETSLLPWERRGTKCACCAKRKLDMDWTCDLIEGSVEQILEAIGDFRKFYHAMELAKACTIHKKLKKEVLKEVETMNNQNEERLQKFVAQQQVLQANISNAREERLLQKFVAKQEAAMAKVNKETEERLQKFMEEHRVEMARIIAGAMKASVVDGAPECKT